MTIPGIKGQGHDSITSNTNLYWFLLGISDERLDQTRRKRLRVEFDGDFGDADVKRTRKSTEDATGGDHRLMIPPQHSEGGDYPISNFFRDMLDPGIYIHTVTTRAWVVILSCNYTT